MTGVYCMLLYSTVLDWGTTGQHTVLWHKVATGLDWGVLYTYWPRLGCTVQLPCSPRRVNSVHQDRGELALSFRVRMLGPLVVASFDVDCARRHTGGLCTTVRDCARLGSTGLDWARLCIHWATLAGHWASYWGPTV